MNTTNAPVLVRIAVTALAAMGLIGCGAAGSQQLNTQDPRTPAQESATSSPPDRNRYIRPAIPGRSDEYPPVAPQRGTQSPTRRHHAAQYALSRPAEL
jgi:hypothetical protein